MTPRLDWIRIVPRGVQAMFGLQGYVNNSGLEYSLLELVKMRASQINGCAYCLDMHFKDATAAGETAQRLYLLDAWREVKFYSERERAALAWTEALTLITEGHVPDAVFDEARRHFNDEELANLSLAVVAVNSWNRLQVAFRPETGAYQPGAAKL
ncbi:MAG TPA: carboxymuconolactone decarboxylase family protein [Steroidobacteraceae bacterium]|nr:carboxymuconolactone decarboxylase family protein [Steroidobacteraceae bacterium]